MNELQLLVDDLRQQEPRNPYITPPLYQPSETHLNKIRQLSLQMRRAKSMRNRTEMLLISYYIGQILETLNSSNRTQCIRILTPYHQRVAVRVYYIFELLGPEQIFRTRSMTLAKIDKLNHPAYENLVNEAVTIAGTQL